MWHAKVTKTTPRDEESNQTITFDVMHGDEVIYKDDAVHTKTEFMIEMVRNAISVRKEQYYEKNPPVVEGDSITIDGKLIKNESVLKEESKDSV